MLGPSVALEPIESALRPKLAGARAFGGLSALLRRGGRGPNVLPLASFFPAVIIMITGPRRGGPPRSRSRPLHRPPAPELSSCHPRWPAARFTSCMIVIMLRGFMPSKAKSLTLAMLPQRILGQTQSLAVAQQVGRGLPGGGPKNSPKAPSTEAFPTTVEWIAHSWSLHG